MKIKGKFLIFLMISSIIFFQSMTANPTGSAIIISEVLYDTPGCDSTCEWVELYNPTTSSIDITGYTLSDNTKSNTLPAFTIPAGGYFVFARSTVDFQNLYGVAPDSALMTLALGNSGDTLTLSDTSSAVLDTVSWENYVAGWSVSAVDQTIRRISDINGQAVDSDSPSDWESSGSTGDPGSGYGGTDSTAPSVNILNPTATTVSGNVVIDFSATDANPINSYKILLDSVQVATTTSYNWDTTTETAGSHTIRAEATDTYGNTGFDEIVITVDNTPASNVIDVYFTDPLAGLPTMDNAAAQQGNISAGLTSMLDGASSSINAALYHLTWQPVIDSLLAAHGRGVTVQLAVMYDNIGEFQSLIDAGIAVHPVNVGSYIMHNKFFIVDSLYVWTGSYNPTETGTLFNANDGIKVQSAELATIYQAEFDQLFADIHGTGKTDNNAEIAMAGSITVEAYFAPKDTGITRLIELIDSANVSLYISTFYFTDNTIYDAVVRARDRGVFIQCVFDYRGWRNTYSEADDIISWGGGIVDANPGVYHHKFAVIDGKIVWTGSTNWSASGFTKNDENSLVIHSSSVAAHYIARTQEYYQDALNYDNSETQAPRIITKHYSGYFYQNFISWRTRMNGNIPSDMVKSYLLWRYNEVTGKFEFLQELNWALGYYSDANIILNQTYYYVVTSLAWDGTHSGPSAEFGIMSYDTGGNYQPVLIPPTGHLASFGADTTAPTVMIKNPLQSQTVSGYLDISANASDTSYVQSFEIFVDGISIGKSSLVNLNTQTLSNGVHSVKVNATDIFGNTGSSSISITVDNTGYIPPVQPAFNAVKVLTYNIEASGQNPSFIQVLQEENADVILLVEAGDMDDSANSTLNDLIVSLNSFFSNEMPYSGVVLYGQGSKYTGLAVLSRFSIVSSKLIPLVTLDTGIVFDVSHDFMDTEIQIGTNSVHYIGSHLKAIAGASNENKRERAQEGIINYMDNLGATNIIYAGDLNSFSPEDTGVLAPNGTLGNGPVSMLLGYGNYSSYAPVETYTDVFRTLNPTDPGYSYPNAPYQSRIDFMFVNPYLAGVMQSSTVGDTISATTGSDHYSVDCTFDLRAWLPSDTTVPSQVTGLTASAASSSQIDLSWNAATDNVGVTGYKVYRGGTLLGTSTTTSYADTGLNTSTTYSYRVSAIDAAANEGAQSASASATTSTPSGLNHVIISEVYYDTVGTDSQEEWVELYNPTSSTVDLTGWTLQDGSSKIFTLSGSIAPGQYLVIARSATGFTALYGSSADITGLTLSLNNGGDQLILRDSLSQQVDFVAWESYVAGWSITASTGNTITRIDIYTDTDTVADWTLAANNGSPGQ